MSIKQILTLCSFAFVLSCSKKDKAEPPPVNEEVKAIQNYLATNADLTTFATSFSKITISDADAAQGLTVFAPEDDAISTYDPNARVYATELTETEIKDHIVKGVFKKANLTNGAKLTSLTGKELIISIDGDKIWINGALMTSSEEDSGHVVYGIDDVLSKKPGIAEITVYDATAWTSNDSLGKVLADADVALYTTNENYKLDMPAFTGKTNAGGKIQFAGVAPGTYYLIAKKGDKFNYVEAEWGPNDHMIAYKVLGIFQTQQEIDAAPHLFGTVPGDFKLADINFDGKLDKNDKIYLPPVSIEVSSNKTVQVKSSIGYTFNHVAFAFKDKAEAQALLDATYTQIGKWQAQQTVLDGILSDDADCTGFPGWCAMDNFTFNASNTIITNFWQSAYTNISSLNRIIINLPLLNLPAAEADPIIAQARAMRGYTNLQLATYFNEIPLLQTIIPSADIMRKTMNEVYDSIKSDLNKGIAVLPARWAGADYRRIGAHACKLLLARVAFAQNDFVKVNQYTGELMQSAAYQLVNKADIFVNDNNAEIIWNMAASIPQEYAAFFIDTVTRNFNPALRYTEVLLLATEAKVQIGESDITGLNMVRARRGEAPLAFVNPSQAREDIRAAWKTEHYREGQRFAKLVKWNLASDVLAAKGFHNWHGRLPIPLTYLDKYPNIQQNPGY